MKRNFYLIGILSLLILSACGRNSLQKDENDAELDGRVGVATCTMIAAAGLYVNVAVPAGWDAEALRRELVIQVTDGEGPVEVSPNSGNPAELSWAGAYEKAGPFTITARLRSVSKTLSNVVSTKTPDACHVAGARVTIGFAPPNLITIQQTE